jgi:microcystin-dependent protein
MPDPYLGEITTFAGNFAPVGWALCQGQLLPIAQNEALFSLIGTTYGGDGVSNFALPNLASRIPLHQGTGSGLSPRVIGELGGSETVTLTTGQLAIHNHIAVCSNTTANNSASPVNNFWSTDPGGNTGAYSTTSGTTMAATAIGNTGGGQPHNNVQPYLVINYIIALEGIYPSRN